MQLTIGKMALDGKADWLCFIDADEFIYLPKMQRPDINAFLGQRKYKRAKALRIESILLTNKAQDDLIENNILELCRHSDLTAKYTKLIINSKLTRKTTFMKSPHKMRGDSILRKEDMYHGHCWCNQRLEYVHSMEQLDVLYNFFKS
jgi:3-deoxy-D-arabino-heptulosonate 7-phosphate (DAHP) synthase class II